MKTEIPCRTSAIDLESACVGNVLLINGSMRRLIVGVSEGVVSMVGRMNTNPETPLIYLEGRIKNYEGPENPLKSYGINPETEEFKKYTRDLLEAGL